jgi:hypothetical protein
MNHGFHGWALIGISQKHGVRTREAWQRMGALSGRRLFKPTFKLACRWTSKNSAPFASRMTPLFTLDAWPSTTLSEMVPNLALGF